MGSRVHEMLEKLYKDLRFSKPNSLEELSDDIKIVKEGYTPKNYKDTGARCIREYYARYHPFNDGKTLGLEQLIAIDIEGYKPGGFIDRLSSSRDEAACALPDWGPGNVRGYK